MFDTENVIPDEYKDLRGGDVESGCIFASLYFFFISLLVCFWIFLIIAIVWNVRYDTIVKRGHKVINVNVDNTTLISDNGVIRVINLTAVINNETKIFGTIYPWMNDRKNNFDNDKFYGKVKKWIIPQGTYLSKNILVNNEQYTRLVAVIDEYNQFWLFYYMAIGLVGFYALSICCGVCCILIAQ